MRKLIIFVLGLVLLSVILTQYEGAETVVASGSSNFDGDDKVIITPTFSWKAENFINTNNVTLTWGTENPPTATSGGTASLAVVLKPFLF